MFSNDELDLIAAGLERLDDYHSNLSESVPALVASGAIEEARGRCFILLAKVRRSKITAQRAVAAEKVE